MTLTLLLTLSRLDASTIVRLVNLVFGS